MASYYVASVRYHGTRIREKQKMMILLLFLCGTFLPVCSSHIRSIIEYIDEDGRQAVIDAADRASINFGGSGKGIVVDAGQFNFLAADLMENDIPRLRSNPHIRSVEPDVYPIFHAVPFDNSGIAEDAGGNYDNENQSSRKHKRRKLAEAIPTAVTMIQADLLSQGPDPPLVCIADSGYALGHPDLPQPPLVSGTDMKLPNGRLLRWNQDISGHGTESAGMIAAIEGNDVGLRGASPGVTLHITRGLDDDKRSTVSQMLLSVQQCVDAGARIINLSLGCPCYDDGPGGSCWSSRCYSQDVERYFASVAAKGIMLIAAAGNQGDEVSFYPASYPDVISAGAANRHLKKFGQSNINDQVELMGLGFAVRVLSVKNTTEYELDAVASGTSVATSAVVASAALLWSHFPDCNSTHIRTALGRTAINIDGCNARTGLGLVQVKAAYDLFLEEGCELDGRLFFGDEVTCNAQFLKTYGPTPSPTPVPTVGPSHHPTPAPTRVSPSAVPSSYVASLTEEPTAPHTERPTEEVTGDSGDVVVSNPSPSPSPTLSSSELNTESDFYLGTDEVTTSEASTARLIWPGFLFVALGIPIVWL